jgi:hypothetical protein
MPEGSDGFVQLILNEFMFVQVIGVTLRPIGADGAVVSPAAIVVTLKVSLTPPMVSTAFTVVE